MEVPRFPAPPLRSISLDVSELPASRRAPGCSELLAAAARRRARSASWLVARSKQHLVVPAGSRRRVRPVFASTTTPGRAQFAAELRMGDDPKESPNGWRESDEEDKDEPPRSYEREDKTPTRTREEKRATEEPEDVICYATDEVGDEKQLDANPRPRAPMAQKLSPLPPRSSEEDRSLGAPAAPKRQKSSGKDASMQTHNLVLYRLRIFPTLKDKAYEGRESFFICRCLRFLCRLALCQFGLAWLLTMWAVLGASAFYVTEGPRERQQVVELKHMQRDLAVNLATELRQLKADDKETEPMWSHKIRQYVARHEKMLLMAVSSGYGEGGESGQLWTYPGCVLFAISVLTTLGFGAPVPRTSAGRTVTVLFGFIGIPAHFLLVLNIGLMLAVRLKRYGILRSYREECQSDPLVYDYLPMPTWVKVTPFLGLGAYYTLGIIGFGFARLKPVADSLLFPLDFTSGGGLSTIAGHVRVLYGLYLEGAVTLAAFAVAVLKVSATQSLTNVGLRYGLLIPA
ncbi:uncharacterized protein LOC106638336 [Copidosoma floridanum]|uniref:uncharacterized protein LOC106638336 n=1 Tax=Copidosoma floridanum TaxID=29053 RepID=UPI0006C94BAA|nr:uncharacterized protein LOC106638336 [Copidosoma floridanum]